MFFNVCPSQDIFKRKILVCLQNLQTLILVNTFLNFKLNLKNSPKTCPKPWGNFMSLGKFYVLGEILCPWGNFKVVNILARGIVPNSGQISSFFFFVFFFSFWKLHEPTRIGAHEICGPELARTNFTPKYVSPGLKRFWNFSPATFRHFFFFSRNQAKEAWEIP